jgi:hypothetical protein
MYEKAIEEKKDNLENIAIQHADKISVYIENFEK